MLPSFLPHVSFTKLVELLSHIITMFLNQLDVKLGNQIEKHRKLWKKLAWERKGAGFVFLLHTRTKIIALQRLFWAVNYIKYVELKYMSPRKNKIS